ncbi:MAG: FtsW/RodA/SpoVE family cell cycle protein [Aerococcaceae bacterium]|nr:FtsW/RodA/SpoVE family cell cycle protein [Aerococcaceae bacterium]
MLPRMLQSVISSIKKRYLYMDKWIALCVLGLIMTSLIMVYSATMYLIEEGNNPAPFGYLMRQWMGVVAGGILALIAMYIPFHWYQNRLVIWGIQIALVLALIYVLRSGTSGGGAQSWIPIAGVRFQPSEFSKMSFIFLGSHLLMYFSREVRLANERARLIERWLPSGLIGMTVLLIGLQPDVGMVLILFALLLLMLIVNARDTSISKLASFGAVALVIATYVFVYFASDKLLETGDFRLQRFGSFINPFKVAQGAGYQLIGAYLAFSRGGWFGVGIGQGITKQLELPAGHTDFILAVIGEELGYIGVLVVLILLFTIVIRLFFWAHKSKHFFNRCVLSGFGVLFFVQVMVNVGGVAGLMPLTGVTLPFVSYGGSSMMASVLAIAVAQRFIIEENQLKGA